MKTIPPFPASDHRSGPYHLARTAIDAAAAATLIPGAGYALGQVVESWVSAPLQRRREEWFTRLGESLIEMQATLLRFDPSKLVENEDFISAVTEATDFAVKTSHREKIEALLNGVLHVASGVRLSEVIRGAFFGCIARFSPTHIAVLRLLADPENTQMSELAGSMTTGSQKHLLQVALPGVDEDALDWVLSDLFKEGFTDAGSFNTTTSGRGLLTKRSSKIGDTFLRFIEKPTG